MTFQDLKLLPALLRAIEELGYEAPSPIQAAAIGPVLEGRDLVGCAQTGTGKTAAFAIPILQRLHGRIAKTHKPIRALILTPTRELALQIGENFDQYGKYLPVRSTVIFGGVGQAPQVERYRGLQGDRPNSCWRCRVRGQVPHLREGTGPAFRLEAMSGEETGPRHARGQARETTTSEGDRA